MTRNRKLSTIFLSAAIASVITPQVALAQKSAQDYFEQGNTHLKQGELKQATKDYNQAIRLNPKFGKAYYKRGLSHIERNNVERSLEDFSQAIRLNQNLAGAYYQRGLITGSGATTGSIKNSRESIEKLKQAIRDLRKATNLYQKQGDQKRYQEAKDSLNWYKKKLNQMTQS